MLTGRDPNLLPQNQPPWTLSVDFSGLVLVRIAKGQGGAQYGNASAHLCKGRDKDHRPFLYVPTEYIVDQTLGTDDQLRDYGLRQISIPGGGYVTEIDVDRSKVRFVNHANQTLEGPVAPQGADDNSKDAARANEGAHNPSPDEWKRLAYSVELREMTAQKLKALESVADCTVFLPSGSLEAQMPQIPLNRRKRWELKDEQNATVGKQRLTDRLTLTAPNMSGEVKLVIDKTGAHGSLGFKVRPGGDGLAVQLGFSSQCCLAPYEIGKAEAELGQYGDFVESGALQAKLKELDPGVTEVHALCPSTYWLEK